MKISDTVFNYNNGEFCGDDVAAQKVVNWLTEQGVPGAEVMRIGNMVWVDTDNGSFHPAGPLEGLWYQAARDLK